MELLDNWFIEDKMFLYAEYIERLNPNSRASLFNEACVRFEKYLLEAQKRGIVPSI